MQSPASACTSRGKATQSVQVARELRARLQRVERDRERDGRWIAGIFRCITEK